jgi:hypothetical protein
MRPINYWITFTALKDKYREVLAVRMVFWMDETRATCEIPEFGIAVDSSDGDWNVQGKALRLLYNAIAKRFGNGVLRQGVQTQAMYSETRDLIFAETTGAVFSYERYIEAHQRRGFAPTMFWVVKLIAEQHEAGALADADAVTPVGQVATAQAVSEQGCRDTESDPAIATRPMCFDDQAVARVLDMEDLRPVATTEHATVKNVTRLERKHGRDMGSPLHFRDFKSPRRFLFVHSGQHRPLSKNGRRFLVDDLAHENAHRLAHFKGRLGRIRSEQNIKRKPGKVFYRIDGNRFSSLLSSVPLGQQLDLFSVHVPHCCYDKSVDSTP